MFWPKTLIFECTAARKCTFRLPFLCSCQNTQDFALQSNFVWFLMIFDVKMAIFGSKLTQTYQSYGFLPRVSFRDEKFRLIFGEIDGFERFWVIDDLSVGRNSIMWQSKIRSNICTTLIKTPQNLTLDDFLHDYAPDGEFGDCFDVIFLTFSDLHQPPFHRMLNFTTICGLGGR